jgi:hypothetical protein
MIEIHFTSATYSRDANAEADCLAKKGSFCFSDGEFIEWKDVG